EAGKSYCSRRFGGATCDDKSAQIYARFDKNDWRIQPAEIYRFRDAEVNSNLSTECLIQLTKLGYDATPFNQILKQNAKREMRLRLGKVTVADVLAAQPVTTNLLKFMRASIKMIGVSN